MKELGAALTNPCVLAVQYDLEHQKQSVFPQIQAPFLSWLLDKSAFNDVSCPLTPGRVSTRHLEEEATAMRLVIFVLIIIAIPITAYTATLKVPSQYPTIQDAIDAASGGDSPD